MDYCKSIGRKLVGEIIGISRIREKKRYFLSSARHRGSCAMKLSEVGDEILLKNEKIKFCEKSLILLMKKSIELFGFTYFNGNPI